MDPGSEASLAAGVQATRPDHLSLVDRHYRLGWLVAAIGLAGACLLFRLADATLRPQSALAFFALVIALGAAHLYFLRLSFEPRLALATGGFAMLICAGAAGGAISLLGLTLERDLVDPGLAAADELLGFDAPAWVAHIADRPAFSWLLGIAYLSSFPLIFASVLLFAAAGAAQRLWELCLAFGATLIVAAICSALFPAIGAFAHYGTPATIREALPAGSGVYHLSTMELYRSGSAVQLDLLKLQGVVTFPSFHTALALMTAFAWRGVAHIGWPMVVWNGLVIVSTIPIGGHYGIDLIGGALLWGLVVLVGRGNGRLDRPA